MTRREQKSWPWISTRLEAKNDCAGEGQQQFNHPIDRIRKTVETLCEVLGLRAQSSRFSEFEEVIITTLQLPVFMTPIQERHELQTKLLSRFLYM
jgi:hypothetical protein